MSHRGALTEAHDAVEAAKTRGETALDANLLAGLRERFDQAVSTGIVHNRHRDWDGNGNHPGFKLASWLQVHADQVWHFTGHFEVEWTSNAAERGVKPAKRHQAVSGYGLTVLDAITRAQEAHPWLPPPTAA